MAMQKRAKRALAGAGLGVALLALTFVLALHVGPFERADRAIFRGFDELQERRGIGPVAKFIADLCDPRPYVFLAAIPVIVALIRRRPRVLIAVGAVLLGANVTTHLLKPEMAAWRPVVGAGSWPSGHATAAMSLALCCVLASPARWRPAVAALGAAFTIAVCYSFLALGWHYPSDVFGGFLVAGTWTMLAVAGVYAAEARWPRQRESERTERISVREALAPQAALVAGAAVVAGLIALARPHEVIAYTRSHEVFVVGAAAIGVLALAVASAITLAMRR
jgi:membrane-associated phospholipid phosphatase